jgi:hypothetical protein
MIDEPLVEIIPEEAIKEAGKRALDARKDLVKRLFPVAISVGLAGPLVQMPWLVDGSIPTWQEAEQLARIFLSLLFVLMSWDWFDKDVENSPPTTLGRFLNDVAIVLAYMLLLILARSETTWTMDLVLIFVLYIFWDVLSAFDQTGGWFSNLRKNYKDAFVRNISQWFSNLRKNYKDAFVRNFSQKTDAVPAINLCWLLYFFGILMLQNLLPYRNPWATIIIMLISFVVLRIETSFVVLRIETSRTQTKGDQRQTIATYGFSTKWRLIAISALLALYTAWLCLGALWSVAVTLWWYIWNRS